MLNQITSHNSILRKYLLVYFAIYFLIISIHLINNQYPYNSFLFRPADIFGDTYKHVCIPVYENMPYFGMKIIGLQDRIYNPFSFLFGKFCRVDRLLPAALHMLAYLLLIYYIVFQFCKFRGGYVYFGISKLKIKYGPSLGVVALVVVLFLSSYPVLITFNRLNLEIFGALFLMLYMRYRATNVFSVLFLGLFFSLKITYLFVLLYFLFKRSDWLKVIASLFFALFLNLFALNNFVGSLEEFVYLFIRNLQIYSEFYSSVFQPYTQSIWNIFNIGVLVNKYAGVEMLNNQYLRFLGIAFSIFIMCLCVRILMRCKDDYCSLFAVLITMILVEPRAADYRSVLLLVPLAGLFSFKNLLTSSEAFLTLLFMYLLPKNLSTSVFLRVLPPELHIGYFLNPILLMGLLIVVFTFVNREVYNENP